MFTARASLVAPFAFVVMGAVAASVEPALAGLPTNVPGPIIGAGLPTLLILGGAYWLIRKVRERR